MPQELRFDSDAVGAFRMLWSVLPSLTRGGEELATTRQAVGRGRRERAAWRREASQRAASPRAPGLRGGAGRIAVTSVVGRPLRSKYTTSVTAPTRRQARAKREPSARRSSTTLPPGTRRAMRTPPGGVRKSGGAPANDPQARMSAGTG